MSQIQTGNIELNPTDFDLYEVLEELVNEFSNLAFQKNLQLILEKDLQKCIIYADRYSVTQLFANLIDNALKYTRQGSVKVNFSRDENGKVITRITDTGIGIAEEFQDLIFSPFTQEEQGYTRKFEGAGLGLSLVKKYCELNNAKITFESKKGVGTTFIVIFD